jgi:hypothetical protein
MPWYVYLAYFFGGAFIANAVPHLLTGIARRPFPSPFASPPFRGLSSPAVNIAWALGNLAFAYLLLVRVRAIDLRQWSHVAPLVAGFTVMAFQVRRSLRRRRAAASASPSSLPNEEL